MDQSSATASRPSSANNQPEALNAVYTVHEKVTIAFNDSDKRYLVDKTALIKVDGFFKSCFTLGLKVSPSMMSRVVGCEEDAI